MLLGQIEHRMCIHKEALTSLDIYHRILRFENYLIAMVARKAIPVTYDLPLIGEVVFLPRGLRYNIEMILFHGVGAPFLNNWQLKDEFKRSENRHQLAENLNKRILYVAIANFVLFPLILLFQILRSFFHYTDIIKREPGFLGVRRWSHYGKVTLRHYNELDHELYARLNRAYHSASQYLNSFTSALGAVIARHLGFVCGSVLAVLAVLTIYDEDVIQVEHVITIMTILAAITAFCRVLIPKENMIWCPEILMTKVLSEVHYLPDSWKGQAHTGTVRIGFSQLFQYKFVHLIESLISPLITPLILYFCLRKKSLEIVDFLRNFTVEVVGVGDICSFAQMDLKKHGSKTWHPNLTTSMNATLEPHERHETDGGKTELSLLHFTLTNPGWKPPPESSVFLENIRANARKDFNALTTLAEENALSTSMYSAGIGGDVLCGAPGLMGLSKRFNNANQGVCGAVNHMEGSMKIHTSGVLGSISHNEYDGVLNDRLFNVNIEESCLRERFNFHPQTKPQDIVALDMSVSTLYLHELHHRFRSASRYTDTPVRPRISGDEPSTNSPHRTRLPLIQSYHQSTSSDSDTRGNIPEILPYQDDGSDPGTSRQRRSSEDVLLNL